MSEQHEHGTDRAAPGEAGESSPAVPPPPGPPNIGPATVYGVGPVTFAGMPLIPTASMPTSHKPLPFPMMLEPIPIAHESAAQGEPEASATGGSDAHLSSTDGGDAGEVSGAGASAENAPLSPMSLQEWLAQAPVSDLSKVHEIQARHELPADAGAPGAPADPMPADDAADEAIEQAPGQPVDVMPIPGMTPITEQEQATPELMEAASEAPAAMAAEPEPISIDDPMSASPIVPAENVESIDPPDLFDVAAATPESEGEPASEFAGEHVPDDLLFDTWKPEETPAAATAESLEAARSVEAAHLEPAHPVEAGDSAEIAPEPPPAGMDGMTVAEATLLDKDLGTTPVEAELPSVAAEGLPSAAAEMTSLEELEPAAEAAAIAPPLPVDEVLPATSIESPFALTPIVSQDEREPGGDVGADGAVALPPATLMDELPSIASTEEDAAEAAPFALTPADKPATADAEPTPAELAAMPPERDVAVADTAVAAGAMVTSADAPETAHDQTASEVFAHAHEDVEGRRGFLSYGIITKLAGLAGLAGCIAGLAILLTACAGLTPLNSERLIAFNGWVMWAVIGLAAVTALQIVWTVLFKTCKVAAIQTGIVTLLVAGLWGAIYFLHDQMAGFDLLLLGEWLAKIAGCGVAVALLGGWIEHRRLREETHVLAALFTNVLAGLGGLFLWMVQTGFKLFPGSGGGH